MKNTNKKGFTIVELVIVIAVIAVLSAVLIPTFGSIIESANNAVDTQLVAQINTILAIEDVLGGGVNDAVEIQKVIKENGLKLETKSRGKYIWYDIENKKAVLAGLDENGLVLETNARAAAAPFNKDTTAPENFIEGYLFLSTESADGLAENIYDLRNPDGADVKASLNETLGKIKNAALKSNLTAMLSTTAVMSKDGATGFIGDNNNSVTRVIVSSEMTNISTATINTVLAYTNVVAVDFHSGVVTAADDAIATLKARTEKPYFVYSNDELKKIDTDNDDIKFLIHKDERGQYIKKVYVENVINGNKETIAEFSIEEEKYEFSYDLNYKYLKGTDSESYDFVAYSFYDDGSNPLAEGAHTHELNSTEKLLIDGDGNLTIYLVYERVATDFKVGDEYYSSKTTTRKLAKGEITSGTITVVSTNAVLDDSFGTELTIPSGVELLLPYKADFTKGAGTSVLTNGNSFNEINFATGLGATQLTIANGVNLVNEGSIHVDACLYYYSTPVQSFIKENQCGVLVVNGTITSTGNITALGVIRGSGSVAANGGSIDEVMTLYDWHGGTNAAMAVGVGSAYAWLASLLGLDLDGKSTTPFHNWKIQNIQIPVTVQSGTTYSAINVVNINDTAIPIDFALAGSSDALFKMNTGSEMIRTVSADGNTKFIISKGSIEDTAKQLHLNNVISYNGTGISATIDFTKISLPLSHFDVDVANGANLTISNNIYKIMPGSSITVDQGGTLNINTEVVICNSFERIHKNMPEKAINVIDKKSRSLITYTLSADGTYFEAWEQKQKWDKGGLFGIGAGWDNDGEKTKLGAEHNVAYADSDYAKNVAIPNAYPVATPAQIVVNGTLNFGNGAAFAGKISEGSGVIKATSEVGGYTIPEGFTHGAGTSAVWYYTCVKGLYGQAVLVGETQSNIAVGTYEYKSVTESGVTISGWFKQP